MKSTGDDFLADQAGAENGNESKLGIQIDARKRAGEDGFHGAAFLFSGSEIDGGINGAGHGEKDDHIAKKTAESGAADFFGGSNVVFFGFEGRDEGVREIIGFKTLFDKIVAKRLQGIFHVSGGKLRLDLALVIMNLDGERRFAAERSVKPGGDLDAGPNLLVGDLVFPVVSVGDNFQVLAGLQGRN